MLGLLPGAGGTQRLLREVIINTKTFQSLFDTHVITSNSYFHISSICHS